MNTRTRGSRPAEQVHPGRGRDAQERAPAAGIVKKSLTRLPGAARRFPTRCWGIQITGRSRWQCCGGWCSDCVTMATWSQASSAASENLHPCMASRELTLGVGAPGSLRRRCCSPNRVLPLERGSSAGVPCIPACHCRGRQGGQARCSRVRLPGSPGTPRAPSTLPLLFGAFTSHLGAKQSWGRSTNKPPMLTRGKVSQPLGKERISPRVHSKHRVLSHEPCGVRGPGAGRPSRGPTLRFPSPRRQPAFFYPSLREEFCAIF